jgi:hypothetical protein
MKLKWEVEARAIVGQWAEIHFLVTDEDDPSFYQRTAVTYPKGATEEQIAATGQSQIDDILNPVSNTGREDQVIHTESEVIDILKEFGVIPGDSVATSLSEAKAISIKVR